MWESHIQSKSFDECYGVRTMQERFDFFTKDIDNYLQTKTDEFLIKIAPFGVTETQATVNFLASWGMQSTIEELYEFVMSQLAEHEESIYEFELFESVVWYVRNCLVYETLHYLELDFIDLLIFEGDVKKDYVLMKFPDECVEELRVAFESADKRTKKEYLESECIRAWLIKLEIIRGENNG